MQSTHPNQAPADAAVIIPTTLRPTLLRAVRSVFTQNFEGRIHLLIGVDIAWGDRGILNLLAAECPEHVMMTVIDPGYSTSQRHGGMHSNFFSGSLRTALSYLANSRYVAYLDDNDWYGANHLTALKTAISGKPWAWSGRWMVHPNQGVICRDEWDSVGPGKGINAERYGGFVQPSGLMLDMHDGHFIVPLWSMAAFADGSGEDRLIFDQLRRLAPGGATEQFTSFCTLSPETLFHAHHHEQFEQRGLAWANDDELCRKIKTLEDDLEKSLEDHRTAESIAAEILTHNPHHAPSLYALALACQAEGKNDQAIVHLASALEIDDSNPQWLTMMAHLALATGQGELSHRIVATRKRRFGA